MELLWAGAAMEWSCSGVELLLDGVFVALSLHMCCAWSCQLWQLPFVRAPVSRAIVNCRIAKVGVSAMPIGLRATAYRLDHYTESFAQMQ